MADHLQGAVVPLDMCGMGSCSGCGRTQVELLVPASFFVVATTLGRSCGVVPKERVGVIGLAVVW